MTRDELIEFAREGLALCLSCGEVQPREEFGATFGLCRECWEAQVFPCEILAAGLAWVDDNEEDGE